MRKLLYRPNGFRRMISAVMAVVFTVSIAGSGLILPSTASACPSNKAEIQILKFNDTNADGVKQSSEAKLGGFTFYIKNLATGHVFTETTHNGSGLTDLVQLDVGRYEITEQVKSGYKNTTTLPKIVEILASDLGKIKPAIEIGNKEVGSIKVTKYLSSNGSSESGPRLAGNWTFSLYKNGALIETKSTNGGDHVHFDGLFVGGGYTVTEDLTGNTGYYLVTRLDQKTLSVCAGDTTDLSVFNAKYAKIIVTKNNAAGGTIKGVTMTLTGPGGTRTGTTGNDGTYTFGNLLPGTYTVAETVPSGWYSVDPKTSVTLTVKTGDTASCAFTNAQFASVTVKKFQDYNLNGTRDSGEPLLSGWTFALKSSDTTVASGITNANGEVTFSNLLNGTYSLVEVAQTGWYATTTLPITVGLSQGQNASFEVGNTYDVTKSFEFTYRNMPAGAKLYATYQVVGGGSGRVDLVRDGTTDAYKGSVKLPVMSVITGSWMIELASGESIALKAPFGPETLSADLLNKNDYYDPTLSGLKYNDLNANGQRDQGEPGIAGWGITLERLVPSGGQIQPNAVVATTWETWATTTTDANGNYSFIDMPPGTYRVVEEQRAGWVNLEHPNGTMVVENGTAITGLLFGNYQPPSVTALKYNDQNGNGVREANEPALSGWTFALYNGETTVTVTTGADGKALFSDLKPGTYVLSEVEQAGWFNTTGLPYTFTLQSGDAGTILVGNALALGFSDVTLVKSADRTKAKPGDLVTYTLTYTNTEPLTVSGLTITDNYDQRYMTPVNVAGGIDNGDTIKWVDNTPLKQGESRTITYTMRVKAAMPAGTTHIGNTATITPYDHQSSWNVDVTVDDPFLPFTGGNWSLIGMFALLAAGLGVFLRRIGRTSH
ncbi:MAG: DUF11 domain-containing protein [Coriobacteriia bacterium]|nr:DUF11 domain-containing protein [Coriobacteriia bacterium]